ncbi:MAG: hypothetical protein H6527_08030 [Actinobacteria bacterium]|nr:hypothetical protein [Actinomycetota bacterium]
MTRIDDRYRVPARGANMSDRLAVLLVADLQDDVVDRDVLRQTARHALRVISTSWRK